MEACMCRVVVTGMGAITPIGNDIETFWNNLKNGVCGIDLIKRFDSSRLKVKLDADIIATFKVKTTGK
jgi:3-oxoacyl-[acyl-carrier-protein] synthase II